MKLAAASSSAMGFQVESVAVDVREVCSGCWLIALTGCPLYQKGIEKIVLEEEEINALCLSIGRL